MIRCAWGWVCGPLKDHCKLFRCRVLFVYNEYCFIIVWYINKYLFVIKNFSFVYLSSMHIGIVFIITIIYMIIHVCIIVLYRCFVSSSNNNSFWMVHFIHLIQLLRWIESIVLNWFDHFVCDVVLYFCFLISFHWYLSRSVL